MALVIMPFANQLNDPVAVIAPDETIWTSGFLRQGWLINEMNFNWFANKV